MNPESRLVYSYLDKDINENALFLCERLRALHPDDLTWVHLQALCCFRLGRYDLAADYSRNNGIQGHHLGCSYIFAQACLKQEQYADGVLALIQAEPLWETCQGTADERSPSGRFLPDISSVQLLLGKLHRANGDKKMAASCFAAALEADPLMWEAFTHLCDIGTTLCVSNIFKLRHERPNHKLSQNTSVKPATPTFDDPSPTIRPGLDRNRRPLNTSSRDYAQQIRFSANDLLAQGEKRATAKSGIPEKDPSNGAFHAMGKSFQAPSKKRYRSNYIPTEASDFPSGSTLNENDVFTSRPASSSALTAPQRRSARLNQGRTVSGLSDRPTIDSGAAQDNLKRIAKPCYPPRPIQRQVSGRDRQDSQHSFVLTERDAKAKPMSAHPPRAVTKPKAPVLQSDDVPNCTVQLLSILEKLGYGYYHLSRFELKASLEAFSSLPTQQQATAWVLSKMGRVQSELMSYRDAKLTFQTLRKVSAAWMEDLEVYSTVLWHLKEDVALACLAHDLSESHYLAPQTWCAVGNLFSLQRHRDEAIKCFRRASQLSPQLARAYSLLGYEHIEVEEYDKAATAFRKALQIDTRHYLAWVGLGRVRDKLGEWDEALKHYLAAKRINSSNALLMTYIANVLGKTGKYRQALEHLDRGLKLDPPKTTVAYIKLQSAGIYLRLGRPTDALQAIQELPQAVPGEAHAHFLLGRAYAMLGIENRGKALKAYTVALSLAPWSEDIKVAIAALEDDT
jgi:anaphase-promoting complex subunit 3